MEQTGEADERCSGCGLPGGTWACQAIFDALLARDFGDAGYFRVHRMMVDTYSLQHPYRYCASAKSLAAHLMGLCWLVEHPRDAAVGAEPLRRWLNGKPSIAKPELPARRGTLTIADIQTASDPRAHAAAVERWARATWDAYAPLHALARHWVEQAFGSGRRIRGTR